MELEFVAFSFHDQVGLYPSIDSIQRWALSFPAHFSR